MACNIIGALLYLYCRTGCRADVVASALSFHPPSPAFYELEDEGDEATDGGEKRRDPTGPWLLHLSEDLRYPKFDYMTSHMLTTKNKTKVPILCFRVPGAKLTLVLSHGNATDCGAMYILYFMIASNCNVNVVGYDYTGYGASSEFGVRPTERQTYQDIETVYDWCCSPASAGDSGGGPGMSTQPLVTDPGKQLVFYGQSLGSGPSCYIAARRPAAGLILHSPILSGIRVLTPSRALWCFDIFPNIDLIKKVRCRTFVMHGLEDREVGVHHGKQLHAAVAPEFQSEPWWVPDRGHNDMLQSNEREYFARLGRFFDEVESGGPRRIEPRPWASSGSGTIPGAASARGVNVPSDDRLSAMALAAGGLVQADDPEDTMFANTSATTTAALELTDEIVQADGDTTVLPDTPVSKQGYYRESADGEVPDTPDSVDPAGTWQGVHSVMKPIVPYRSAKISEEREIASIKVALLAEGEAGFAGGIEKDLVGVFEKKTKK